MTLKPTDLANMYVMFVGMRPLNRWKLPPVEDITFQITDDLDCLGSYCHDGDKHIITISRAKSSHLATIQKTLCHEIIHMCRGEHPYKYLLHDAYFLRRSTAIALEFGFDPLEL